MNIRKLVFIYSNISLQFCPRSIIHGRRFFLQEFLIDNFFSPMGYRNVKNRDAGDVPVLQFLLMYDISQKCIGNNIHNDCCHNDPSQDGNGGFFNFDFQK